MRYFPRKDCKPLLDSQLTNILLTSTVLFQSPKSIAPVLMLLAPSPSLGDCSRVLGLLDSCQTIPFVGRQLGSLPVRSRPTSRNRLSLHFPSAMSSIPASSSSFQPIFSAALSEYAKQTGIDLATHPSAQILQNCRSADNIMDLFQDKAVQFRAHRDGNRKLISCLKPVVQVLHSFSGFLAEAASLVSPCEPIQSFRSPLSTLSPPGAIPARKCNSGWR